MRSGSGRKTQPTKTAAGTQKFEESADRSFDVQGQRAPHAPAHDLIKLRGRLPSGNPVPQLRRQRDQLEQGSNRTSPRSTNASRVSRLNAQLRRVSTK